MYSNFSLFCFVCTCLSRYPDVTLLRTKAVCRNMKPLNMLMRQKHYSFSCNLCLILFYENYKSMVQVSRPGQLNHGHCKSGQLLFYELA